MSTPILTFFNNKGGVGKTSLVYHLSWMFSELGKRVVVADLDPQANLTSAFLNDDSIEKIWNGKASEATTIYRCIKPLTRTGSYAEPELTSISDNLHLIVGDVQLSMFEDCLSENWDKGLSEDAYRPMLILSSFWQVIQAGANEVHADIILVDIGPNLGAINRSVLIATDYVVIPLGADLFSLQGLKNLGPTLKNWRKEWKKRWDEWQENAKTEEDKTLQLPNGKMQPIGYLCQQYGVRLNRPVLAYEKWINRIPSEYRQAVAATQSQKRKPPKVNNDHFCLGNIKHYRSLVPMAQEARKPIFKLAVADGLTGSHISAAQAANEDFKKLAKKIAKKIDLSL